MNWRQRMKFRHNKKRNPAFIFEALTREFAKAKLHKDQEKLNRVKRVMQEVFNKDGLLYKQLRLYKALTETRDVDYITAEKIIAEVHRVFCSVIRLPKVLLNFLINILTTSSSTGSSSF